MSFNKEKFQKFLYGGSGFIYGVGIGVPCGFVLSLFAFFLFDLLKLLASDVVSSILFFVILCVFSLSLGYFYGKKGMQFYIERQRNGGWFLGRAAGMLAAYGLIIYVVLTWYPLCTGGIAWFVGFFAAFTLYFGFQFLGYCAEQLLNQFKKYHSRAG